MVSKFSRITGCQSHSALVTDSAGSVETIGHRATGARLLFKISKRCDHVAREKSKFYLDDSQGRAMPLNDVFMRNRERSAQIRRSRAADRRSHVDHRR